MNINKMIREEFHKILKEEVPPPPPAGQEGGENPEENPFASFMNKAWNYVKDAGGSALAAPAAQPAATTASAAAPKEVVFQNKNATSKNCRKIGERPPNSIGLVCVQNSKKPDDPKSFSVAVIEEEGFVWVDKDDENNLAVKTSDPDTIKKYSRKPLKRRPEVLELQQLINKWLGSSLNPATQTYRGMEASKKSKVNEDGLWGPKTQRGLDHIRKFDKDMPPNGRGIPKIIAYLKSIESKMIPLTTPIAQPTTGTTAQPAAEKTGPNPVSSSFTFKDMDAFKSWLPKQTTEYLANKTFAIKAGKDENYIIKYDSSGKQIGEPQKVKTTSLEESKLIRKMIIQEVRKSRILKEEETRIYDPAKEEDQDFFKKRDDETLDQFNDRIRYNAAKLDMQNKSSTTAAQPVTPTAPQAATVSPQVALAQQIMFYVNQAVGQRFDVSAAKMKSVTSLAGIQQEINVLRRSNPDFPSRAKIPDLTKRLQAILNWVKTNPDKVKKTLLAGQVPLEPTASAQPAKPYVQNPTPVSGGRLEPRENLEESKLIHKMIIQEVRKALRK